MSAYTMNQIDDAVETEFPLLAKFIRMCRYLDNLGETGTDFDFPKKLVNEADRFLNMLGLYWKKEDSQENIRKAVFNLSTA